MNIAQKTITTSSAYLHRTRHLNRCSSEDEHSASSEVANKSEVQTTTVRTVSHEGGHTETVTVRKVTRVIRVEGSGDGIDEAALLDQLRKHADDVTHSEDTGSSEQTEEHVTEDGQRVVRRVTRTVRMVTSGDPSHTESILQQLAENAGVPWDTLSGHEGQGQSTEQTTVSEDGHTKTVTVTRAVKHIPAHSDIDQLMSMNPFTHDDTDTLIPENRPEHDTEQQHSHHEDSELISAELPEQQHSYTEEVHLHHSHADADQLISVEEPKQEHSHAEIDQPFTIDHPEHHFMIPDGNLLSQHDHQQSQPDEDHHEKLPSRADISQPLITDQLDEQHSHVDTIDQPQHHSDDETHHLDHSEHHTVQPFTIDQPQHHSDDETDLLGHPEQHVDQPFTIDQPQHHSDDETHHLDHPEQHQTHADVDQLVSIDQSHHHYPHNQDKLISVDQSEHYNPEAPDTHQMVPYTDHWPDVPHDKFGDVFSQTIDTDPDAHLFGESDVDNLSRDHAKQYTEENDHVIANGMKDKYQTLLQDDSANLVDVEHMNKPCDLNLMQQSMYGSDLDLAADADSTEDPQTEDDTLIPPTTTRYEYIMTLIKLYLEQASKAINFLLEYAGLKIGT
jgi:hypothetical protein